MEKGPESRPEEEIDILDHPKIIHASEIADIRPTLSFEEDPPDYTGVAATGQWITVPGPEFVEDGVVWHYTDSTGLLGILSSGRIWATASFMLNDSTEIEYGIRVASTVSERIIEKSRKRMHLAQEEYIRSVFEASFQLLKAPTLFVLCASLNGDDLAQWRGYGGQSGYAIAFDTSRMPRLVHPDSPPQVARTAFSMPGWGKVIYDKMEQIKLLGSAIDFLALTAPKPDTDKKSETYERILQAGVSAITTILIHFKDDGFASENEVRLAFDARKWRSLMRFRGGKFGVTPYVELAYGEDPDYSGKGVYITTNKPSRLRIPEVRIGPTPHPDAALNGLMTLLWSGGYTDATVSTSQIPYR